MDQDFSVGNQKFEAVVIGGGPTGLTAALALAKSGREVALVAPDRAPRRDGRTVAIMQGGLEILDGLGVWSHVRHASAPLVKLRIIDDTDNLFRPPPATFSASEIGYDAFGYNIAIADLIAGLEEACRATPALKRRYGEVKLLSTKGDHIEILLDDGSILTATFIVAADGAQSPSRSFAGIGFKEWDYPQTAITAMLSHTRDHDDISTEFHTREGPFTLVPLPGKRSSLVWMMKRDKADRVLRSDPDIFAHMLEKQSHHMLGKMTLESDRGALPMRGMRVDRASGNRVALVGEAAHVFPPIGAQGLNLGLRDIQSLVDILQTHSDITKALDVYASERATDIGMRTQGVDLLNRSLISDFLPADFARGIGLVALQTIPPLRQIAMRAGMGLPIQWPFARRQ